MSSVGCRVAYWLSQGAPPQEHGTFFLLVVATPIASGLHSTTFPLQASCLGLCLGKHAALALAPPLARVNHIHAAGVTYSGSMVSPQTRILNHPSARATIIPLLKKPMSIFDVALPSEILTRAQRTSKVEGCVQVHGSYPPESNRLQSLAVC